MLDYNEFPYQKHFFDCIFSLENLIDRIFPELHSKNINELKNLKIFEKEIDDYCDYLTIIFRSDIRETYNNIREQNRNLFFRNLLRQIENTNAFYTESLKIHNINDFLKPILIKLILENENKVQYLKNEYSEFVPFLSVYFQTKNKTIFNSRTTEEWFLNALEELNIKEGETGFQGKITAFFDVQECRKKLFKTTIYKKDLINYVNYIYGKDVIPKSSNYSKSLNSQLELERHISNFPIPTE